MLSKVKLLPNELQDIILFQYLDDIEIRIFFKKPKKLRKNKFFDDLNLLLVKIMTDIYHDSNSNKIIYAIQLSISKCYQIKIDLNHEKIIIKTKIINYNQSMEYYPLKTIIF